MAISKRDPATKRGFTVNDTDNSEDNQLTNNHKREVSCDNYPVEPGVSVRAHVFRQPAHQSGEEEAEKGCNRRRNYTGNDSVGLWRGYYPRFQGRNGP